MAGPLHHHRKLPGLAKKKREMLASGRPIGAFNLSSRVQRGALPQLLFSPSWVVPTCMADYSIPSTEPGRGRLACSVDNQHAVYVNFPFDF
jgi:hypothetical protein